MKRLDEKLNNEQRELLLELYVEGLDEADDKKVANVLQFALRDESLDAQIDEINSFYAAEANLSDAASDSRLVSELAQESFPSAVAERKEQEMFLTLSDVAKQIEAKGNIAVTDEQANEKLLAAKIPLTKYSLPEIKRMAESLKIKASENFWRIFHKTAILLEMKHGHEQAMQAAREKKIRRRTDKPDERKQRTGNK